MSKSINNINPAKIAMQGNITLLNSLLEQIITPIIRLKDAAELNADNNSFGDVGEFIDVDDTNKLLSEIDQGLKILKNIKDSKEIDVLLIAAISNWSGLDLAGSNIGDHLEVGRGAQSKLTFGKSSNSQVELQIDGDISDLFRTLSDIIGSFHDGLEVETIAEQTDMVQKSAFAIVDSQDKKIELNKCAMTLRILSEYQNMHRVAIKFQNSEEFLGSDLGRAIEFIKNESLNEKNEVLAAEITKYLVILEDLCDGLDMQKESIKKRAGIARDSMSSGMRRSSIFSRGASADEESAAAVAAVEKESSLNNSHIDASDMNSFTMALKLDRRFRQEFIKASFDDHTDDKIIPILAFAMTADFVQVGDKYQYTPNVDKITRGVIDICDKEIKISMPKDIGAISPMGSAELKITTAEESFLKCFNHTQEDGNILNVKASLLKDLRGSSNEDVVSEQGSGGGGNKNEVTFESFDDLKECLKDVGDKVIKGIFSSTMSTASSNFHQKQQESSQSSQPSRGADNEKPKSTLKSMGKRLSVSSLFTGASSKSR